MKAKAKTEPVKRLLSAHPDVELLDGSCEAEIEFEQSGIIRKVWVDKPDAEVFGLLELADNNPIVCASSVSVPSGSATLALIAVGPLIRAGILIEPPSLVYSFSPDADSIERAFVSAGWDGGATVAFEVQDLGSVLAMTAICVIQTVESELLDALYDGIYGGSFFVRRIEDGDWDTKLVAGQPFAAYRMRFAPDEPLSLLSIRVMAEAEGKCGPAQVVHAMNIMCGFEESLGIV
ncbi:MAG TPA: hypothetical protein VGL56_15525 [Fimbriimonadaceae bacterium]|jgi:N-acetyl-gamma-glutamylphosphate reductase